MSAKQVAALLGVCTETVLRLARNGELGGYKIGRQWRFTAADLGALRTPPRPRLDPAVTFLTVPPLPVLPQLPRRSPRAAPFARIDPYADLLSETTRRRRANPP